jgi:hypothetical protein
LQRIFLGIDVGYLFSQHPEYTSKNPIKSTTQWFFGGFIQPNVMPHEQTPLASIQVLFPGQQVLYSPDLAIVLGKSRKALQHLINRGTFPFELKKVGNRWCASIFTVAAYLEPGKSIQQNFQQTYFEPTKKTTRPSNKQTQSNRTSLSSKLMEMRFSATSQMRKVCGNHLEPDFIQFIDDFIAALTQPSDDGEFEISVLFLQEGCIRKSGYVEKFFTQSDAAYAVYQLQNQLTEVGCEIVVRNQNIALYESIVESDSSWQCIGFDESNFAETLNLIRYIENQVLKSKSELFLIGVSEDWLSQQSNEVAREILELFANAPDPHFFGLLSTQTQFIRSVGFVEWYWYCWCSIQNHCIFVIALEQISDLETLANFIESAETVMAKKDKLIEFSRKFDTKTNYQVVNAWFEANISK